MGKVESINALKTFLAIIFLLLLLILLNETILSDDGFYFLCYVGTFCNDSLCRKMYLWIRCQGHPVAQ